MIGIDVVDVARLRGALERSPRLEEKLFTKKERIYCRRQVDPAVHFAGTLAAKEAAIKALRLGPLVAWSSRIEIERDDAGVPVARVPSREARIPVSISHDGPVAAAVALSLDG